MTIEQSYKRRPPKPPMVSASGSPTTTLYNVYTDTSGNVNCVNTHSNVLESQNTDALTTLQYAVNHCSGSTIFVRGGTYSLSGPLVCDNKPFYMIGEKVATNGDAGYGGAAADTILQANYTNNASGASLVSCNNQSGFVKQFFEKVVIDCNSKVSIGLNAYDIRERQPFLNDVGIFNATDTGVLWGYSIYSNCINMIVGNCTKYGLHVPTASSNVINTTYWFGGKLHANGTNVYIENGNDFGFQGTIMEGNSSGGNAVKHAIGVNIGRYRDCSFESNLASGQVVVDDAGNNITYDNCRFDSSNNYIAFNIDQFACYNKIINNTFQANTSGMTVSINLKAGSSGTVLIGNTQGVNTPLTSVVVNNSGTILTKTGNSF